jgi:hypothetical protein
VRLRALANNPLKLVVLKLPKLSQDIIFGFLVVFDVDPIEVTVPDIVTL